MNIDSPPSTPNPEPQPDQDAMLDLLGSSMQAAAELLGMIEGPASAQAAKLHAEIADAAARTDHAALKTLMHTWGAWVRADFGDVPQEIEAHPDRSARQACQLALHGFREGVRIEAEEKELGNRIVAGFAGSQDEQARMFAECRERVLKNASPDLLDTAAEGFFGSVSPSLLEAMVADSERSAVLFFKLDRPACRGLAECLLELATAIQARDTVLHAGCAQKMLDYKIHDFGEIRAELREHPDSELREMGLAYLTNVVEYMSGDAAQKLAELEQMVTTLPVQ